MSKQTATKISIYEQDMVLTTQEELRNTKHVEGVQFECFQCKQVKPVQTSGGTGYGYDENNRPLCYSCCNSNEAARFSKADHFCAYLSSDGKTITTWPGGVLAQVSKLWSVANNMAGEILGIRAVDASGNRWHGTSPGRGMYCRLHRSKS